MNAISFTSKQKQMLNLPHKTWNIYTGAVRSGKSYGTMFLIPQRIGAHYTQPCLIVGKTLATVERNVLRPLRTIFGGYDVGDIKGRADGGRYVVMPLIFKIVSMLIAVYSGVSFGYSMMERRRSTVKKKLRIFSQFRARIDDPNGKVGDERFVVNIPTDVAVEKVRAKVAREKRAAEERLRREQEKTKEVPTVVVEQATSPTEEQELTPLLARFMAVK